MTIREPKVVCPSCGGPTALTTYGPEPALCLPCRRVFGVDLPPPTPSDASSPDNPVWGAPAAFGLLLLSLVALVTADACSTPFYLFYATWKGLPFPFETENHFDPGITFARMALSAVAHLITFVVAWVLVTDGGRKSFWESLGWGWRDRVGLRQVASLAVVLQVFTILFGLVVREPESMPFKQILDSSPLVKVMVAIIAVATAPLVEEVVFRGVLYPALARPFGRAAAIIVVSTIFLYIHSAQYAGALAIMVPLGALSVALTALRAYTGSLLPSFALHTIFNGITVFFMLLPQPQS